MGSFISKEDIKDIEISLFNNKSLKTYCNLYNFTKFLYYVLLAILLINFYKLLM